MRSPPKTKMIYFIKPIGERGPIKIGCSVAANIRLQTLASVSPVRLELLASTPGDHLCESRLHKHFSLQRRHGEWFEASEHLESIIEAVKSGASIDDAIVGIVPAAREACVRKVVNDEALAALAARLAESRARRDRGVEIRAHKNAVRTRVAELMSHGAHTYKQVGIILGVSRQRAHQIHKSIRCCASAAE